jgi:branched-chain amino acid aminotransferase
VDRETKHAGTVHYKFDDSPFLLYEVMRTTKGIIVFLEDHLERLKNSLATLAPDHFFNGHDPVENMNCLLMANGYREGNIKLLCRPSASGLTYASYYIPHTYPGENDYRRGVTLSAVRVERNDPNMKQIRINHYIKQKVQSALNSGFAYDFLLINNQGYITEGSRSNFFLIKDNAIYSAEEQWILPGITRKHVLEIAESAGINIIESKIKLEEADRFEAAFISGTSPKILPVSKIDDYRFMPDHVVTLLIMNEFNNRLNAYLLSKNK